MGQSKRIEFVDLAKGVCIILMVLRHADLDIPMLQYLRMPFYFLVSGFFFRTYGGLSGLVVKKTNKLLIPFAFFYLLPFILLYPCDRLIGTMFMGEGSLVGDLLGMCYVNNPIWFLLCLFWCNILFYFTTFCQNKWLRLLLNVAYFAVGLCLWNNRVFIPLHLSTAFLAMPYYYVGNCLASTNCLYETKYDKYNAPVSLGIITVLAAITFFTGVSANVEWFRNSYEGPIGIYFVFSFLMVAAALLLCKSIKRIPFVSYCGRYSIIILGTHWLFFNPAWWLFRFLPSQSLAQSLAAFALVLSVSACLIPIMKKYVPFLVAQKDIFQIEKR